MNRYFTSNKKTGFTLIEMLIVVSIIAVLALMAMPNNNSRAVQLQVVESLDLIDGYKQYIEAYYAFSGSFPEDNEAAAMPGSDEIRGNYLAALHVADGALNLEFGQKMNEQHHGKFLSLRPVYVDSDVLSPISWVCGTDSIPTGMETSAENITDLEPEFLPLRCR